MTMPSLIIRASGVQEMNILGITQLQDMQLRNESANCIYNWKKYQNLQLINTLTITKLYAYVCGIFRPYWFADIHASILGREQTVIIPIHWP